MGMFHEYSANIYLPGGKKLLPKKVRTKLESAKIIFIDRWALIFRKPFKQSFYIILYNQQYKQKNDRCHERKIEPPC